MITRKQAIWGILALLLIVLTLAAPKIGQLEKQKRTDAYLNEGYKLAFQIVQFHRDNRHLPDDSADLFTVLKPVHHSPLFPSPMDVDESASLWTWINDGRAKPRLHRRVDDQLQDYWIVFKEEQHHQFLIEARIESQHPFWSSGILPNFGPRRSLEIKAERTFAHNCCVESGKK